MFHIHLDSITSKWFFAAWEIRNFMFYPCRQKRILTNQSICFICSTFPVLRNDVFTDLSLARKQDENGHRETFSRSNDSTQGPPQASIPCSSSSLPSPTILTTRRSAARVLAHSSSPDNCFANHRHSAAAAAAGDERVKISATCPLERRRQRPPSSLPSRPLGRGV